MALRYTTLVSIGIFCLWVSIGGFAKDTGFNPNTLWGWLSSPGSLAHLTTFLVSLTTICTYVQGLMKKPVPIWVSQAGICLSAYFWMWYVDPKTLSLLAIATAFSHAVVYLLHILIEYDKET